ncbi:MAG: hypothetical protein ABIO68_04705 [Sphingomicrobium sp.]
MASEEVVSIIRECIEQNITPAGLFRVPVISETGDQVARDISDALERAGYEIVMRNEEG